MNTTINAINETKVNRFATACVNSCRKLINSVKASLLREFSNQVETHDRLLQLALNEAEAIADQTPYPGLFFPVLAEEKVRVVNQWAARQQAVRRSELHTQYAVQL